MVLEAGKTYLSLGGAGGGGGGAGSKGKQCGEKTHGNLM